MPSVDLVVPFVAQTEIGYCGAACVQMLLHAKGSVGKSPNEQEQLWEAIKANTRSRGKPIAGVAQSLCEAFPNKICEKCHSKKICWCAHPTALQATLAQYFVGTHIGVIKQKDEDALTDTMVACLNNGLAPVVLVRKGQHWVVVYGFDSNSPVPVSINDPALPYPISVALSKWQADYLVAMDCGAFKNVSVVVGDDSAPPLPPRPKSKAKRGVKRRRSKS